MKKYTLTALALSLALPVAAQAQGRMTESQLIQFAIDRGICADNGVISAQYVSPTENRVAVVCNVPAGVGSATGGLGGGAGVGAAIAGLALIAVAAGGGGSSSDTQ